MQITAIEFDELRVYQASPEARVVWWSFRLTNRDLSGIPVDIHRSFSPDQEFEKVGTVLWPQTYFVDSEVNLGDFWRNAYYSLSAMVDGHTIETSREGLYGSPPPMVQEMVKQFDISLQFGGDPVFIYLRRSRIRCPDCWDAVSKKVTRSKCPTCFATGYLGGFYSPILTCVKISSEMKSNQPDATLREGAQTVFKASRFPEVRPRDVIREVNSGKLWRIVNITPVRMNGYMIHQSLVMTRLETSEIENDLPIPESLEYVIAPHWSDRIRNHEDKVARNDPEKPVTEARLWR